MRQDGRIAASARLAHPLRPPTMSAAVAGDALSPISAMVRRTASSSKGPAPTREGAMVNPQRRGQSAKGRPERLPSASKTGTRRRPSVRQKKAAPPRPSRPGRRRPRPSSEGRQRRGWVQRRPPPRHTPPEREPGRRKTHGAQRTATRTGWAATTGETRSRRARQSSEKGQQTGRPARSGLTLAACTGSSGWSPPTRRGRRSC